MESLTKIRICLLIVMLELFIVGVTAFPLLVRGDLHRAAVGGDPGSAEVGKIGEANRKSGGYAGAGAYYKAFSKARDSGAPARLA